MTNLRKSRIGRIALLILFIVSQLVEMIAEFRSVFRIYMESKKKAKRIKKA